MTAPALMETLIAEQRVADKEPVFVFSQDISKAYDAVARHVGKEIAWRRLGLSEEFIKLLMIMDRDSETAVLTAVGITDELIGVEEGKFESERGFSQGASESPPGWVALYDMFLELQKGIAEGDPIQLGTSEGETMEYYGSIFADDALWVSSS